uniref:Uncharacterized protein n=1 Tax=Anguilla anguilla TaxID=7936 RepID=A0A0E9UUI6_ANGAN
MVFCIPRPAFALLNRLLRRKHIVPPQEIPFSVFWIVKSAFSFFFPWPHHSC